MICYTFGLLTSLQHNVDIYSASPVAANACPNVPSFVHGVVTHPSPSTPSTTTLYNPPQGDRLIHLFYVTTDWLSCSDTLMWQYTEMSYIVILHCTHTVWVFVWQGSMISYTFGLLKQAVGHRSVDAEKRPSTSSPQPWPIQANRSGSKFCAFLCVYQWLSVVITCFFFALFFVLVLTLYCHYSSGYNDLSKCRCSKDRDSSDNCRFFSWEHEMTCNRCRSKGHSVYCCIKWVDSWSKYRLVFEALLKTLLSLRRRSQGHPFAQLRMTALSHMQHKCHALSQYAYQYCW